MVCEDICVYFYIFVYKYLCVCVCVSACGVVLGQAGLHASNICRGLESEHCMQEQKKIPDQDDGCLRASCTHQHAHLRPVPHLLNPWIKLMSEWQGQDFNKYPTKLSNLMFDQWMILVQQLWAVKHFHYKLEMFWTEWFHRLAMQFFFFLQRWKIMKI